MKGCLGVMTTRTFMDATTTGNLTLLLFPVFSVFFFFCTIFFWWSSNDLSFGSTNSQPVYPLIFAFKNHFNHSITTEIRRKKTRVIEEEEEEGKTSYSSTGGFRQNMCLWKPHVFWEGWFPHCVFSLQWSSVIDPILKKRLGRFLECVRFETNGRPCQYCKTSRINFLHKKFLTGGDPCWCKTCTILYKGPHGCDDYDG